VKTALGWLIALSLLLLLGFVWNLMVTMGVIWADMGDPDAGGYPLVLAKDGVEGMAILLRLVLFLQAGLVIALAVRTGLIEFGWPSLAAFALIVVALSGPTIPLLLVATWAGLGLEFLAWRYQVVPRWWMTVRLPFTMAVSVIAMIGMAQV